MNFELTFTPEQEAFRARVRAWLDEHAPSDMEHPADPGQLTAEGYRKQRQMGRDLGTKGWLYPTFPTEYGGGGLSAEDAIIIEQELDRHGFTLPPYYDSGGKLGAASIMVWGTEEQKRHFLPPIFRGEVRTWQLLTEPDAGSDLANVSTTARRDGDEYIINGQKIYVGSTHGAEMSWMLVNTDPGGPRHQNLSWFMVPMHLPGVSWAPMDLLFAGNERGAASGHKQTVYFENVRLPAFNLIGGENNGWRVAGTHLELEHGLMQTSLRGDSLWERVARLYKEAKSDGTPLMDSPGAPSLLADMYIDSQIGRLLHLRNYWLQSTGRPVTYHGPQAYLHIKRSALRTAKAIHKLFGPYALTTDSEVGLEDGHVEVQQRGSIVAQHPGGTVEIQKVIMARRLGIGRGEPQKSGRLK